MKRLFISGIGTDVGKTVVSAILARAWGLSYWKPVQAGELEWTDSDKVKDWSSGQVPVFPETYRLQRPMSPHAAAKKEGVRIALDDLDPPAIEEGLLIEGAGGLLVPLNDEGDSMLDLAESLDAEIILVSWNFLGSINQTRLSCELLQHRAVPVRGLIFCGPENPDTENFLEGIIPFPVLGRIPEREPGASMVEDEASRFQGMPPFRRTR